MTHRVSRAALTTFLAIASATFAIAQTPPQQDETAPKAASSPHQRETTSTRAKEAPAATKTDPSAASTPHQRQATEGKMAATSQADHDRMMKDCVKKEQERNSSMSAERAKKTCTDQMKTHANETKQR
jgi:hypothetical protein